MNSIGEYDGAMFSLSRITAPCAEDESNLPDYARLPLPVHAQSNYQLSRLRIQGINIDMVNTGAKGPFGWIDGGAVDMDCYIVSPPPEHLDERTIVLDSLATDDLSLEKWSSDMDEIREKLVEGVFQPLRAKLRDELRDRQSVLQMRLNQLSSLELDDLFENMTAEEIMALEEGRQDLTAAVDDKVVAEEGRQDLTAAVEERRQDVNASVEEEAAVEPVAVVTAIDSDAQSLDINAEERPHVPSILFLIKLRLNNLHASIPTNPSSELSFIPQTLIRPVVAYLNAQTIRGRKTSTPPLLLSFQLPISNFNGAWTFYQCEWMAKMEETVGATLARMVLGAYQQMSQQARRSVEKKEHHSTDPTTTNNTNSAKNDHTGTPPYQNASWMNWIWHSSTHSPQIPPTPHHGNTDPVPDDTQTRTRLVTRVGWWSLQEMSRAAMSTWDWVQHRPVQTCTRTQDPFSEVYNEIVWSSSPTSRKKPD
jgi:hypothetical protein